MEPVIVPVAAAKASPFCHIVIPAPDLDKAMSFYQSVFGWKVHASFPGQKYWFFESGNISGAFNGNNKPSAGSVVLVLQVEDMQVVLDRIVECGGTIKRGRSRIGEADSGFDAYFFDSNGNEMGLYSDR